jgi:HD-GYP domain-containing protein (c-di-GMP phosphodiesterase class II)
LTTDRPYKAACSAGEAMAELRREVARGWRSATIVDALASAVEDGAISTERNPSA